VYSISTDILLSDDEDESPPTNFFFDPQSKYNNNNKKKSSYNSRTKSAKVDNMYATVNNVKQSNISSQDKAIMLHAAARKK
jgi:hypothetical protein